MILRINSDYFSKSYSVVCFYNSEAVFLVRQELNSYTNYISDESYASNVYRMIINY